MQEKNTDRWEKERAKNRGATLGRIYRLQMQKSIEASAIERHEDKLSTFLSQSKTNSGGKKQCKWGINVLNNATSSDRITDLKSKKAKQ